MKEDDLPPFRPEYNGGINHPRDEYGNLIPSPLSVEQERVAKETLARNEALRGMPAKSVNTQERERIQDEANARAVARQRSFWIER